MSVKKHTKKDNGNQMLDKPKIADTFNNYFSNIAQTIVNDIKYEGTKDFNYYLNRHSTFKINNVDEEAVKIVMHNLPTKQWWTRSYLFKLKQIEPAVIKSLTLVINQSAKFSR